MWTNSRTPVFKFKVGMVVLFLVMAVGTFLAANGMDPMQVKDTESGNISVEFKDADIQDVFRVLALKGNVSIVSDPDVKGLVTVQITDVPWEKVLDVICRTYGYAYEREGNIIRVTTLDKQGQENLVTEVFALNYAKAENVAAAVAEMRSDRGKIKFDSRANLVIVTDIPTNIYKIGQVIERLDSMTPQVTIEAKIIETALTNSEDLGIKWNASYTATMASRPTTFPWPASGVGDAYNSYMPLGDKIDSFPSLTKPSMPLGTSDDFSFGILDGSSFSVLLEAIASRGKTKVLSNPRITTLDNEPAEIHVGTDWPIANYSYNEDQDRFVISGWEYKSYGILLQVTPTINQNGYVTLKLHPEISDKQEEIEFQGARVPVLSTQTADATVMIKDGDTLVIGGLIKNKTVDTKTKVPLLGDLPIIGALFTHSAQEETRNDLLIFITPHVVRDAKLTKRKKIADVLDSAAKLAETDYSNMGMDELMQGSGDLLKEDSSAGEQPAEQTKAGMQQSDEAVQQEEDESSMQSEEYPSDLDLGNITDDGLNEQPWPQSDPFAVNAPVSEEKAKPGKDASGNKGMLFKKE